MLNLLRRTDCATNLIRSQHILQGKNSMSTFLPTTAWSQERIRYTIETYQTLFENEVVLEQVNRVIERLSVALQNGNQILFFGNGGSAADAQHFAAELVGRFLQERRALPAQALSTNPSIVTAIGNDYGYEHVFSRQIRALGRRGDIAFGISTSGNSPNVIEALQAAREMGLYTVALAGRTGGALASVSDECICIPADGSPRIQEGHLLFGHIICEGIESSLFPPA